MITLKKSFIKSNIKSRGEHRYFIEQAERALVEELVDFHASDTGLLQSMDPLGKGSIAPAVKYHILKKDPDNEPRYRARYDGDDLILCLLYIPEVAGTLRALLRWYINKQLRRYINKKGETYYDTGTTEHHFPDYHGVGKACSVHITITKRPINCLKDYSYAGADVTVVWTTCKGAPIKQEVQVIFITTPFYLISDDIAEKYASFHAKSQHMVALAVAETFYDEAMMNALGVYIHRRKIANRRSKSSVGS